MVDDVVGNAKIFPWCSTDLANSDTKLRSCHRAIDSGNVGTEVRLKSLVLRYPTSKLFGIIGRRHSTKQLRRFAFEIAGCALKIVGTSLKLGGLAKLAGYASN